ncbi:MAG: hypothetical protein HQL02_03940 [Nitrospirae bacterium]|nr:hypothetical protein [Nitrospirota bacterium]
MYSFVILGYPPKSFNTWKDSHKSVKERYKKILCDALKNDNPDFKKYDGNDEVYGIIYYFYKENLGHDVDNISKPIWDCLGGYLYEDDRQLKFTLNGIYDVSDDKAWRFETADSNWEIVLDLIDRLENTNHLLYVECGRMDISFFKFNIEKLEE